MLTTITEQKAQVTNTTAAEKISRLITIEKEGVKYISSVVVRVYEEGRYRYRFYPRYSECPKDVFESVKDATALIIQEALNIANQDNQNEKVH